MLRAGSDEGDSKGTGLVSGTRLAPPIPRERDVRRFFLGTNGGGIHRNLSANLVDDHLKPETARIDRVLGKTELNITNIVRILGGGLIALGTNGSLSPSLLPSSSQITRNGGPGADPRHSLRRWPWNRRSGVVLCVAWLEGGSARRIAEQFTGVDLSTRLPPLPQRVPSHANRHAPKKRRNT